MSDIMIGVIECFALVIDYDNTCSSNFKIKRIIKSWTPVTAGVHYLRSVI